MRLLQALVLILIAVVVGTAQSQDVVILGEKTPDFPPGVFTDGGKYRIPDLRGKAVGLFFFDPNEASLQRDSTGRNEIVAALRDRPVVFFGVAANATPAQAAAFQRISGLAMPIFADNLGLMQARYTMKIRTPGNAYQFRLLDYEGKMAGLEFNKGKIEKILDESALSGTMFKDIEIKPHLAHAASPFEHGQFAIGWKNLLAIRKATTKKADLATLDKIQETVKKQITRWKSEADAAATTAPLEAYDYYQRVAATLPNDEMGKASLAALKKLAEEKSVKPELAARAAYQKLFTTMTTATPDQKPAVAAALVELSKKHRDTPTGTKAGILADEMGYEPKKTKK